MVQTVIGIDEKIRCRGRFSFCIMQAGPSYAEAFLTVLRNVTKEDTVQYVLAVLDQLLAGTLPNIPELVELSCFT